MQLKKQDKLSYVRLIKEAMDKAGGMKPVELSRLCGGYPSETDISRMLHNKDIWASKLFKVLEALRLIKTEEPPCHIKCDTRMRSIIMDVKEVLESGTHWGGIP